jgi:hypothetical protein
MDSEQDTGPDERPKESDEPPYISSPKKRDHAKISFCENSPNPQRPSKKPRSNRTPVADETSDSRDTPIRPGERSFVIAFLRLSF